MIKVINGPYTVDECDTLTKEKRVNIALKEETHTKAKLIAVLMGVPLGDYLARAVDEAVKRDKKRLEEAVKK